MVTPTSPPEAAADEPPAAGAADVDVSVPVLALDPHAARPATSTSPAALAAIRVNLMETPLNRGR